jgi:hypothetical protein
VTAGTVVSKGEFARLSNVSAGRVSQWISEGKLTGEALEGEGRSAKIRVPVAVQQLRGRLDMSQRFGLNGLSTRLDRDRRESAEPSQASGAPPAREEADEGVVKLDRPEVSELPRAFAAPPAQDSVEEKLKLQRLQQAELQTRRLIEQERVRQGLYVETQQARAETQRALGDLLKMFEGALPDFAGALAAEFNLPNRDVLHVLRGEFRRLRERAAVRAAEEAEGASAVVVVEDGEQDQIEP